MIIERSGPGNEQEDVLFLCTGNSARSQMAEGMLGHYAGGCYEVFSAGLEPRSVKPLAVKAMDEIGIDISNQTSKGIDRFLGKETIHYAVFVCEKAEENCPSIYTLALNKLSWHMEDPAAFEGREDKKIEKFRETRGELDSRIKRWLAEQD